MTAKKYLFKSSWRSTAKLFHVYAKTQEEAWVKARKSKEIVGCMDLIFVKELEEGNNEIKRS